MKGVIRIIFKKANLIAKATKSSTIKKIYYVSTVFKQTVFVDADEDLEVDDQEYNVNLNLHIPVHTFESFIDVLLELRKDFKVACAYSKEPITYVNNPSNNANIVGDKSYAFAYWDSVLNNVLYSNLKRFNVFIYLDEFDRYANLYVYQKKK